MYSLCEKEKKNGISFKSFVQFSSLAANVGSSPDTNFQMVP